MALDKIWLSQFTGTFGKVYDTPFASRLEQALENVIHNIIKARQFQITAADFEQCLHPVLIALRHFNLLPQFGNQ